MKVRISKSGRELYADILIADTPWSRLVGLMFRREPKGAEGILLVPGNAIHTCFMRYPIDVVFLDGANRIVKIVRGLKPWRQTWIYFKARKALEVPAGKVPADLKEGDVLEVQHV